MSTQNSSVGSLTRGIDQLLDGAPRDYTSAGRSYHEKHPRTIDTDEDIERFCAYRKHHHGESRTESLDLLHRMSVAQANDMPWYLDLAQPLGITRPGAEDEDEDVQYDVVCSVVQEPGSSAQATNNSSHVSQSLNKDIQGPGHLGAGSEQLHHAAVGLQPEPAAHELVDVNRGSRDASTTEVTVGWEIEFIVPLAKGNLTRELLTDGRFLVSEEEQVDILGMAEGYSARKHMASLLREAGIPAVHLDIHETDRDASDLPGAEALEMADPYAVWRVKSEYFCMGLDPGCVGLELSSRKLPANKLGFSELDQVLRLTRNNVLVRLSEDCGLHVHIDASALDLNEQRHFVCLYLIVETVLFSLCHPSRRVSEWCCQVYDSSRLASKANDLVRKGGHAWDCGDWPLAKDVPARMHLMHRAIHDLDSEELRNGLMQSYVPDTRNALAMKIVGQGEYTFEFRHFQGSFDSALIQNWTRVCLGLVMAAKGLGIYRQHPASQLYDVFYRVSCRPEEEAWKCLLRVLDLGDSIPFWERIRSSYASSQDGGLDAQSGLNPEAWGRVSQYLPRVD